MCSVNFLIARSICSSKLLACIENWVSSMFFLNLAQSVECDGLDGAIFEALKAMSRIFGEWPDDNSVIIFSKCNFWLLTLIIATSKMSELCLMSVGYLVGVVGAMIVVSSHCSMY